MGKVARYFGGLVIALVIGALGSGLWEKVFSPLLNFIAGMVAELLSSYSQSYSDSIYAAASNLHGVNSTEGVVLFMASLFSFALIVYGFHLSAKANFDIEEGINKVGYFYMAGLYILAGGAIFSMVMFQGAKFSAMKSARGYSLTNMDVARPYIGDAKYHYLMSEFLMVDNEAEFKEFVKNLRSVSGESGVNFEDYKDL